MVSYGMRLEKGKTYPQVLISFTTSDEPGS